MRFLKLKTLIVFTLMVNSSFSQNEPSETNLNTNNMMIRISEIEINPNDLEHYIAILKEESAASVKLEPGVISIFPMFQNEHPNQIRILEIYKNKEAYESHLQTPHFKHYKSTTLQMVKSLKLVDMEAIDIETMDLIFKKLN